MPMSRRQVIAKTALPWYKKWQNWLFAALGILGILLAGWLLYTLLATDTGNIASEETPAITQEQEVVQGLHPPSDTNDHDTLKEQLTAKEEQLKDLQDQLDEAKKDLATKTDELANLEADNAALQASRDEAINQRDSYQSQVSSAETRAANAQAELEQQKAQVDKYYQLAEKNQKSKYEWQSAALIMAAELENAGLRVPPMPNQ